MARDNGRVAYLDGIRGLAIGAVLALHWWATYMPVFHAGALGVDIFFVLSGFIITTILWRRPGEGPLVRSWLGFLGRRARRLYPAILGLVLGTALIYAVTPGAAVGPLTVLRRGGLVLTQAVDLWIAILQPADDQATQPFTHTWSLATEWHFYLLWPVILLLLRRRGVAARRAAIGTLVAALVLYVAALPLDYAWFYLGPLARSGEILAGAALALWLQGTDASVPSRVPARAAQAAALASLVVVGLIVVLGPHSNQGDFFKLVGEPVTVAGTVVLIWAGHRHPGGVAYRLLCHPWLVFVGGISYSLYLWHEIPMFLLEDAWPSVPRPLIGLVVVASTAALTTLSYRFLERPFLTSQGSSLRAASQATARRIGSKVAG